MSIKFEEPILGWRTLKDVYDHYLAQTPSDEGICAAEAIERAEKRARVREVAIQVQKMMPAEQRDEVVGSIKEDKNRANWLRAIVTQLMIKDAVAGVWFAIGRGVNSSAHELIDPYHWNFLLLNTEKGIVGRDDFRFEDLRCAFTKDVPEAHPIRAAIRITREDSPSVSSAVAGVVGAQKIVSPPTAPFGVQDDGHHDGPGRPSTFHLIDSEFEKRRERNLLECSLTKEARALSVWFKTAHPHRQPYQPKTIANRLRTRYLAAKVDLKRPKL